MHHYTFHIGDYVKATVHLSNDEDLCLRRLLDMYYDSESPIPKETDLVSRRLRLETSLVISVLKEFFFEGENGWHNKRCDDEIGRFHAKQDSARSNGKLGGRPKKTESKAKKTGSVNLANPTETESKANHKPIYIKEEAAPVWQDGLTAIINSGVTEQTARRFLGKHFKADKDKLAEVITGVLANKPIDPMAYIAAAMKKREASNDALASLIRRST